MSTNDPMYEQLAKQILGVISGWDKITTADPEDGEYNPSNNHLYTLPDLFLQLKQLIDRIDPDQIEYLIKIISEHINDDRNPHKTTLEKMGTNVIKELYDLWLETGHIGNKDVFLKQLFQYVKIADLDTTLRGEALDEVTSVYDVYQSILRHNTDLEAHDNLLRAIFPGSPLPGHPTYCVHGCIGVPDAVEVTRTGAQYVCNPYGVLTLVPDNVLEPDCSFGEPAYPIFGAYSNSLTYSEDFTNNHWAKLNVTVEDSSSIYSPRVQNKFAQYLKESKDTEPKRHGVTARFTAEADKAYTASIYVYPVNRTSFNITLSGAWDLGEYATIGFDLERNLVHLNDARDETRITGGMTRLPSGWYRVWITFKPNVAGTGSIQYNLCDIYDGDATYNGDGASGACVFGAMVNEGTMVAPYTPTSGSVSNVSATIVRLPLDTEWYNKDASTIIMETTNITSMVQGASHELYTFGAGATSISMTARFPTTHKNRIYFTTYGETSAALKNRWSVAYTGKRIVFGQSYDTKSITYCYSGSEPVEDAITEKVNSKAKYFYIGCDRFQKNCMNGYLFRFEYYPFKCTKDNLEFFVGCLFDEFASSY